MKPRGRAGLDGAERHVVVGADDHVGLAVGGEAGLGDRQRLGAGEVGGLLEDDLVLVLDRVEDVVDALVAVDRRAGAGLALQVEDLRAVREGRDDRLGLGLAALDVVGADMGEDALDAVDAAVDRDDRDAGLRPPARRRARGR